MGYKECVTTNNHAVHNTFASAIYQNGTLVTSKTIFDVTTIRMRSSNCIITVL